MKSKQFDSHFVLMQLTQSGTFSTFTINETRLSDKAVFCFESRSKLISPPTHILPSFLAFAAGEANGAAIAPTTASRQPICLFFYSGSGP